MNRAVLPLSRALIVGLDGFQALPLLPGAKNGADAVGRLLRRRFGYTISALFNQTATRGALTRELDWLAAPEIERVIVYIATRSLSAQTLALYNTEPANVSTGYPLDRLLRQIDALSARQVVLLLDVEFDPPSFDAPAALGLRPLDSSAHADSSASKGGRLLLCAGPRAWQTRERWSDHDASLFTAQITYGLRGNAADEAGHIGAEALARYVIADVQQVSKGVMVPWAAWFGSSDDLSFQTEPPLELPRELTDNLRSGVAALRHRAIEDIARLIDKGDATVRTLAIAKLREVAAESDIGSARKMAENELWARQIDPDERDLLPLWREPNADRPGVAPLPEPAQLPEAELPGDRRNTWLTVAVMIGVALVVVFIILHFS